MNDVEEIFLDVSDLEPCEPLQLSLAAALALETGQYVRIMHRREPFPLYELLAEKGFTWYTRPGKQTAFEVWVWIAEDRLVCEHMVGQHGVENG